MARDAATVGEIRDTTTKTYEVLIETNGFQPTAKDIAGAVRAIVGAPTTETAFEPQTMVEVREISPPITVRQGGN